ncbi:MAG TPA: pilus assembly protein PilN [Gammaproteobacteria bacterium]|nr:pilus assembly protein PilN [Gammaproteobacteria bacterium]
MARINLLPWRDELRKERQTTFIIILVIMLVIAGAAMGGVHFYYADRIDYQSKRNAYLNKEIKKLDIQISQIKTFESEKANLQAHLDIIQRLQSSRSEIVHLFEEIVTTLPEGVYLKSLSQNGNNLTITGVAQSNARVSSYMWNIEKSNWLGAPKLDVISTSRSGRRRVSNFTLKAQQINKAASGSENKK